MVKSSAPLCSASCFRAFRPSATALIVDPLLYLSVVTALVLILSAVLSLWVKKTGSRIFAAL